MAVPGDIHFKGTERFEVRRHLGSGSSGAVYEAFDRERGVHLALKTLHQGEPEALYRFKREFRALADISHPNLVQLHELTNEGKLWFFTMDLVKGVDFITYVRGRRGRKSFQEIETRLRATAGQLAQGICALHQAGKLHRDIKPSNVLVTETGKVVILDFGLVTEATSQQTYESFTESLLGTPAYMAPEQGAGTQVSEATDWYCVGTLLYEAVTGQPPFVGQFVRVMLDKQTREPEPPSLRVPELPEDLDLLCQGLLRRDPAGRLEGSEVLQCLGVVADQRPKMAPGSVLAKQLVGRRAELEGLWDAYTTMRSEQAVVAFVHGPSGLGKTALVSHFLQEVRDREPQAVTLVGRCYENETVPYKAFDSLIDQLTRYLRSLPYADAASLVPRDILALARVFPVLRRVDAVTLARRTVLEIPDTQQLRRRAFATLREMLTRIAETRPMVLFLDDLQWGDADSATLLSEVMGPPEPPPLLLIGAYRDEDALTSPLIRALRRDRPMKLDTHLELKIGPLDAEAARELTLELLGKRTSWTERLATVVARESRGNPLFIQELVLHAPAELGTSGDSLPVTTLDEVLLARISLLPAESRRLLEIVAVARRPIEIEMARRAAQVGPEEQSALVLLRNQQLVRSTGSRDEDLVETFHHAVRRAVLGGLSKVELAVHHLRLARSLEVSGHTDSEVLAIHLSKAGIAEQAAEHAIEAADRASGSLAFERAARLYRWALDLYPGDRARQRALRGKLAEALVKAGHGFEAAEVYQQLATGARAAEALEMRRRAAEQWLITGHTEKGMAALSEVLAGVGMKIPSNSWHALPGLLLRRLWLRLRGLRFTERDSTQVAAEKLSLVDICWAAAMGLGMVDTVSGAAFQARHLLLALETGELSRVIRALALEVAYQSSAGGRRRDRTAALIETTRRLADRSQDPHSQGLTSLTAGMAAFLEGHWQKALRLLEQASELLRERSTAVTWEIDNIEFFTLRCHAHLGEIAELRRRLAKSLKEAQERGDRYVQNNLLTRVSYLIHLASDDPDRCREDLRRTFEGLARQGFHWQHYWHLHAQVETCLYEGDAMPALRLLRQEWSKVAGARMFRVQNVTIESHALRGRVAVAVAATDSVPEQERGSHLALAERDARTIEAERMAWGDPQAMLLRASVAALRGDRHRAAALAATAEASFAAAEMSLHATVARRRLGELRGDAEVVRAADEALRAQTVRRPEKLADIFAPGRWT